MRLPIVLVCAAMWVAAAVSASPPVPDHRALLEALIGPGELQVREVARFRGYRLWKGELRGTDPYSGGVQRTRLDIYASTEPGPRPLLLILPPFRGQTFVDGNFADLFARRGFVVVRLDPDRDQFQASQPADFVNRFLVREVRNLRALISAMQADARFATDKTRTAVLGFSLGGIRGAVLHGVDQRVGAAALVVAGGDLPGILASTKLQQIVQWRRRQFGAPPDVEQIIGLQEPTDDPVALRRALGKVVQIEPLSYAGRSPHGSVLLLRSRGDEFVRDRYQAQLIAAYRAAGQRYQVLVHEGLLSGHYPTILASYRRHRETVFRFIRQSLDAPPLVKPKGGLSDG